MRRIPALFVAGAIAEACSWAALLIGMFFKYVVVHNEIGRGLITAAAEPVTQS